MKELIQDPVYLKFIEKFGRIYDFQIKVWKSIKEENTLVIAPTGYGKTFAAMLPIFSELRKGEKEGIRAIYVTPLKALNRDIFQQLAAFADSVDLNMDVRHGDTTAHAKRLQTLMPPDIIVTTPETLQGMLSGKIIKNHLKNLKYVIVDEIHELFTSKRGTQLSLALERLSMVSNFRRIGVSATIGDKKEISKFLVGVGHKAKIIEVGEKKEYNINILTPEHNKDVKRTSEELFITKNSAFNVLKIKQVAETSKKVLVFVNTREMAELLGVRLGKVGVEVGVHHSSLSKTKRLEVEEDFKSGKLSVIVATSSLELGIDIGEIENVIQYSSPRQATKLVQRIGRAGHKKDIVSNGTILVQDLDDKTECLAIMQKVDEGWLEKPIMPKNSYDVLSHQILGFLINEKMNKEAIFKIIKRSYPYSKLTRRDFENVIEVLKVNRLVFEENEFLIRTRRGLLHFFNSISTIPDEKNFLVKDAELNKVVGVLHQGFVVNKCEIGNTIVMQGTPWLITDMKGNVIEVVRNPSSEGAIPSWEGEMIPVPREIAERASILRKEYSQSKKLPDDKTIVVERNKEMIVINSCFGSKINETFSKVLGAFISSKIGSSVNTKIDPYRIMFLLPKKEDFELDKEMIKEISPEWVDYIIKTSTKNSSQYLYSFYKVARRFGVVSKDAEFSHFYTRKLMEVYKDSIVEDEVMSELLREKMDVKGLKEIITKIKNKEIKIFFKKGLSETSLSGIKKSSFGSFIKPEYAYAEILDIIDNRLNSKVLYFVCTHCKNPIGSFRVRNIPEKFKCPFCKAKTLGFVPENKKIEAKKYLKKGQNENIEQTGELFLNYGAKCCYVLAAYGIGPRKAKKILQKSYKTKKDFIMEIIKAEKEFIKNKRFWAD